MEKKQKKLEADDRVISIYREIENLLLHYKDKITQLEEIREDLLKKYEIVNDDEKTSK